MSRDITVSPLENVGNLTSAKINTCSLKNANIPITSISKIFVPISRILQIGGTNLSQIFEIKDSHMISGVSHVVQPCSLIFFVLCIIAAFQLAIWAGFQFLVIIGPPEFIRA